MRATSGKFILRLIVSLPIISILSDGFLYADPDQGDQPYYDYDKTMCISPYYVRVAVGDVTYGCPAKMDRIGLHCYGQCPKNYEVVGLECWEKCRANYTASWWTYCTMNEELMDKVIPCKQFIYCSQISAIEHQHGGVSKHTDVKCRNCPQDHRPIGCRCLPLKHYRKTMFRRSKLMWYNCREDQQDKVDGKCYRQCRPNFLPGGKVCWQRCPSSHPYDFGAICSKSQRLGVDDPIYEVGTAIIEEMRSTTPDSRHVRDPTAFQHIVEHAFIDARVKKARLRMCPLYYY